MLKQTKTVLATTALLMAAMQSAQAHPPLNGVQITDANYAGKGCPAGSASVVLSSDKKTVSMLFDQYEVTAGGPGERTRTRSKCDIALSMKVPNGVSVSLVDADYRGFIDLPRGATARFTRDYFFAGERGPRLQAKWRGTKDDDFLIKDRLGVFAQTWSACGANVILRSKTTASLRTRRGREAAMGVDSADFNAKTVFRYSFRYRAC